MHPLREVCACPSCKVSADGDIECFNSGEVLAVTSSPNHKASVWPVAPDYQSMRDAASTIRSFLSG